MFTKILFKLHRISGWVLLVLAILYLVSGYGLTRQIIPYSLESNFKFFDSELSLLSPNKFLKIKRNWIKNWGGKLGF